MNHFTVFTTERIIFDNCRLLTKIRDQLNKDLFFASRAYDIELKKVKFCKDRLVLQVTGKIHQVNEFIQFILLRMSQKAERTLFRTYCLLNSHLL